MTLSRQHVLHIFLTDLQKKEKENQRNLEKVVLKEENIKTLVGVKRGVNLSHLKGNLGKVERVENLVAKKEKNK